MTRYFPRAALLVAVLLALPLTLAACSNTPSDMTVHGTVTFRTLNGVPPAKAFPDVQANLNPPPPGPDGITYDPPLQVDITADDGPGNYAGQPWGEADASMTLKSSTAKKVVYAFTAQVPDDGVLYQVSVPCCYAPDEPLTGESFTLQEMQQGVALCFGSACPG